MNKKILFAFCLIWFVACTPDAKFEPAQGGDQIGPDNSSEPTVTIEPTKDPIPTLPIEPLTINPDRPVFLAWPLPDYIGIARISQYPNTPWSWNYLGLNEGYQCPPMFGYLLDLDSLPFWRDINIPEEQDIYQADPHNFEMVECYSSEGPMGENGHEGTDIKAPANTPVYASADGKVLEWRLSGTTSMLVIKHCLQGDWDATGGCVDGRQWYTTYMHINPINNLLQENIDIKQGDLIGNIYDQTINSHLHFEVGLEKRSYTNFVNPWGIDEPPWEDCMWLDQSLCFSPNPKYEKMMVFTPTGEISIKYGSEEFFLISSRLDFKQVTFSDSLMIGLDESNNLYIGEGQQYGSTHVFQPIDWEKIAGNTLDVQISEHRIGILDNNANFYIFDSESPVQWLLQAENVQAFSISSKRAGYLNSSGGLFIKENALDGEWRMTAQDVIAFQVIDNRIAYVDINRQLFVNEGQITEEFVKMYQGVKAFQVINQRIGVIDNLGNLYVNEGNLRGNWVLMTEGIKFFQLADNRILACQIKGECLIKKGNLYGEWVNLTLPVGGEVILNGNLPVFIE